MTLLLDLELDSLSQDLSLYLQTCSVEKIQNCLSLKRAKVKQKNNLLANRPIRLPHMWSENIDVKN